MRKASNNAVYNAPILDMRASQSRYSRAVCLFALLSIVPSVLASTWHAPEEQLARKIAAATGPGAVAVEVVNRSSLGHADVEEVRRGLAAELATLGVRSVSADQAAATVRITLSENLQNYVWVAEITQGNGEASVVMVATARSGGAQPDHSTVSLTIRKTLLWSDENRILDVAFVSANPPRMVALQPENVVLLKLQGSLWVVEQSLPITHLHPWPRDLRGRLALRKDHLFDAYLPGVFCRSTTAMPLAIACYESDDPWPLGADQSGLSAFFSPARNFFTGALSPGLEKQTTVKAFYSAAMLPRDKYKLWILATVDGQVHLLDGVTDQVAPKPGWGSDIASVHSGCGLGWQLLVTGNTETKRETIKAFEMLDREPAGVSEPVEFSGNITALWTDWDGTTALAVAQNADTGKYEAYRLSISCNQ
jgi:hypothetical protein